MKKLFLTFAAAALLSAGVAGAQQKVTVIYDEALVPEYTLPDVLTFNNGKKVQSVKDWERRRKELVKIFAEEEFGYAPGRPKAEHFKVLTEDKNAFGGKATRKEVAIYLDKEETFYIKLLLYVPNDRKGPAPSFLGINFKGNHTTTNEEGVSLPDENQLKRYGVGINRKNVAYEGLGRGTQTDRWEFEYVISQGYASATFYTGDVDPDVDDGFWNGVHGLYKGERKNNSWGTIAAWAWGLSRAMDYLETDPDIASDKVIVHGHSRLGKTALWAAALDKRFAMTISNASGAGGAALNRRCFGETVAIVQWFTHWFCRNYYKWAGRENEMPFDQHELIALTAPRPVYVESCELDKWADPKGEMLSLAAASPVWELYGYKGFHEEELPAINTPVWADRQGYHLREGKHNILLFDWQQYCAFADKFFK